MKKTPRGRRFFIPFFIALKDCKNYSRIWIRSREFHNKEGRATSWQKHTRPSTKGGFRPTLMISINVKGKSVNTLKESYYQTVILWFGVCLICQRPYQHYGTYSRKTPYQFGPFSIQRVYCVNCKKSHALLPCFIIPYARVLDVIREAAIVGICFNTHTIEELAELMNVDPTTVL